MVAMRDVDTHRMVQRPLAEHEKRRIIESLKAIEGLKKTLHELLNR